MKLRYRPEIDGLRAIAVGAIILYHAEITILDHEPFKGGFIGVDIFFVISGYLITSIILKELVTTGSFSFKYFYERRIRRILPAILFVMLVSLPFAWKYLLPSSFVDFSKSILSSLGFSSNFYFHYSGQQYNAESGLLKPFLHTWSLSVEEQFYILFPIVLLVTFKYFRKYLIHILILGFVISLGLADWGSRNHPSFNFYVLPTRGWELLAGSILAYFEITKGHRSENKILNSILPSIGLFLIILTIIFFKSHFRHPSLYSLPAIVGTCLIIWFSNKDQIIIKILSTKLFVGIGLISYSLYLWHYPIFTYARITNFTSGNLINKLLLGILILLLSIFSYHFIEKFFRNKKINYKKIFRLIIIIIFSITLVNSYVLLKDGKISYIYKLSKNIYLNNDIFNENLRAKSWRYVNNHNIQTFQSKDKIKILIIGDSHSKDLFNTFIQNSNLFTKYEFLRYAVDNKNSLNFDKNLNKVDFIKFNQSKIFNQSDIIIISDYFQFEEDFDKLNIFLEIFKDKKKIILTSNSNIYLEPKKSDFDILGTRIHNFTLFDEFLLKNKKEKKFIDKDLSSEDKNKINNYYYENINLDKLNNINTKLKKLAIKHNIQFLNKIDFQCNMSKKMCFGVTDEGLKTHYDNNGHFTLEGAKFFGKKIYEINWLKIN
jgi:peptidoglycan/LPS O-acetylase OafA/YrhL